MMATATMSININTETIYLPISVELLKQLLAKKIEIDGEHWRPTAVNEAHLVERYGEYFPAINIGWEKVSE